ncbi:MAG TPA: hypothetical protein DCF91_09070 [Porphyromonadaceae bacterium]|nr:hypothetical protein [Porphyromonadaceae bacterium]
MTLNNKTDFTLLQSSALIELILTEHHAYVRKESPELIALVEKVNRVHGNTHSELNEVASIVNLIMADMDVHQMKEERILFPYIEAMESAQNTGATLPQSCFGNVQNPINAMEHDHDEVQSLLARLEEITDKYTAPADACTSYKSLYQRLEAFQKNTLRHIHLENDVLFKQAIKLQQCVNE